MAPTQSKLAKRVKNRKGTTSSFDILPPKIRLRGLKTVLMVAKDLGFKIVKEAIPIKGQTRAHNDVTSNDRAKESSIERYSTIWDAFFDYCLAVGDYESAICVHPSYTIRSPCAPSVKSVVNFANYRVYGPDEVHKCSVTHRPIKFKHSKSTVMCRGDWTSLSTLKLLGSAFSKLGEHYPKLTGAYHDICSNCVALRDSNGDDAKGCMEGHYGNPAYLPRGNITKATKFKTCVKTLESYIDLNYLARSTIAYLPSELREIRDHCISQNDKNDLMFWTILIVSTKLFLRIEEALSLKVEDFLMELASTTKYRVTSLMCKVKGKRDTNDVHLKLWDDETCPEFSAVRVLLIWMTISGIKSGFLFPEDDLLKKKSSKIGNCDSPMTYESYIKKLKHITSTVLCRDISKSSTVIIGTHAARRTGLLLACWYFFGQNGEQKKEVLSDTILLAALSNDARNSVCYGSIQSDMRHKNGTSTMTYLADSATLYQLVQQSAPNRAKEKVGEYKSIYIKTVDHARNITRQRQELSLSELSDWYVFDILGLRKNKSVVSQMTISAVFDISCGSVADKFTNLSASHQFLLEALGVDQFETFMTLKSEETSSTVQNSTEKEEKTKNATQVQMVHVGDHFREDFKKTNDWSKKLDIARAACLEARNQVVNYGKKMKHLKITCKMHSTLYQYGRIVECCDTCFRGDESRFLKKNPKFTLNFKCPKHQKHVFDFFKKKD